MPNPSRSATAFVVHTPRIRIIRMSTSGWSERGLAPNPEREQHEACGDAAERLRREPVPGGRFADGDEHGREPCGHQRGADPVDTAGHANRRLRDEHVNSRGGDDDRDQRQPEEVVEREVIDDRPGEDDARPAADTEQRRHQADPAGDPFAWELVADDPEREREDAARSALDDTAGEHQREATSQARRRRCRPRAVRARSSAAAPCRTCRRGARSAASRPMR